MDSKKEIYEIEFTEDARDEIREIYEYISKNLVNENAAKRLMRKMRKNVMDLAESPKIYAKIKKKDRMKRKATERWSVLHATRRSSLSWDQDCLSLHLLPLTRTHPLQLRQSPVTQKRPVFVHRWTAAHHLPLQSRLAQWFP